ncbi:MAG: hypothetical protein EBZ78_13825 [Verrucomicrobia bacterium]|nr:hypothetical protein [Verrucomicrobiota bacterium]
MPRKELKYPGQIEAWLQDWGQQLKEPGSLVLIGSGGLLWHAAQRGLETPLPENSMDVDPVTTSQAVALLGYEAMIGSEFEKNHGWHVNLMPSAVLREMNTGWEERASRKHYGLLEVVVPSVEDLMVPKLKRGEPRDILHASWAKQLR